MSTYKSKQQRDANGARSVMYQYKPDNKDDSSWWVRHELPAGNWNTLNMSHVPESTSAMYAPRGRAKVGFF